MKKIVYTMIAGAALVALLVWRDYTPPPDTPDRPPYKVAELLRAPGACDVEASTRYLEKALIGTASRQETRQAVRESFFIDADPDCLAKKLPELSEDEIADFEGTVDRARDYEFEQKYGEES